MPEVRVSCICPGRVGAPFIAGRLQEYQIPSEHEDMASTPDAQAAVVKKLPPAACI